jgi:hypothetical protein
MSAGGDFAGVVDAVFDLRDVEAAYRRAEAGAMLGKVVVQMVGACGSPASRVARGRERLGRTARDVA